MLITIQKRTNITVDDRRAVFALARVRKTSDVTKESHEVFIGNALRARMNWPKRDENTPELVRAAKQMAAFLDLEFKANAEREAAKALKIKAARDADIAANADQVAA